MLLYQQTTLEGVNYDFGLAVFLKIETQMMVISYKINSCRMPSNIQKLTSLRSPPTSSYVPLVKNDPLSVKYAVPGLVPDWTRLCS